MFVKISIILHLVIALVHSEKLTFLGGKNPKESMVRYSNWYAKEKASLNFQFKTAKKDGILFFIRGAGDSKEVHLRLALENGRLTFAVSHSNLEHIAEDFGTDLNDLNWHNVTVIRNHRSTLFELDGTQRVMTKLHWKELLDLKSDLYVGSTDDAESGEEYVFLILAVIVMVTNIGRVCVFR